MHWDPQQYGRFADERGRPFLDLLGRVDAPAPRRVVDVGCGPGRLTALLAERWPDAIVEGIDSSPQMIGSAQPLARPGLSFALADAASWQPPADADVVISNATLQWLPTHRDLLTRWSAALPDGGWLAFQVPGNFGSFSHALMREVAATPRWRDSLTGILRHDDAVGTPEEYAGLLSRAGLRIDVWETTYVHVLDGPDPVLEWVRGTGLRPILAALSPADAAEFETTYAAELRHAYPRTATGTLFPFRRIFAVGRKS